MRRCVLLVGLVVVLCVWKTEANSRNGKKFWSDLWGTDNSALPTSLENIDIDTDGSGDDNTGRGGDDEDDFEASGDEGVPNEEDNTGHKTTLPDDDDEDDDKLNEDIDFGPDNQPDEGLTTDDEDLYDESGSGTTDSPTKDVNSVPTTSRPLTACENLQLNAVKVTEWKPECDEMGGFRKKQCTFDIATKEKHCWCVDPKGIEIRGTRLLFPTTPDCDFGANLTSCVFLLVQHSQGLIGTYRPSCTKDGEYEPMQCHGTECWCVDMYGNEITGSFMTKPELPTCGEVKEEIVKATTSKPLGMPGTGDGGYTIHESDEDSKEKVEDNNVVVNLGPEINIDPEDTRDQVQEEETNMVGMQSPTKHTEGGIMGQPGLLAAIIGGSVVLLLVVILLVMFIVYRMRKKDEGSYPLDEQKYQNYSYSKAPDKEFYA